MIHCWDEVTLDEISEDITVGHVGPMANQYVDVGVPFLRSLNVEPFRINTLDLKYISREFHRSLKKSALKPGDIVIVRTGKPGSCAVIPNWLHDANCSDVVVVRAGPKVRASYICYVVNSTASHHIDAHTVGAVQQHFNVGSARQIRFRLPPIVEQDRILSVLGALDDKIELNRRMNETLEAMAGALFKDWFVDFGPTRAKVEGHAPYLAPEVWELFPDRLGDDGKPVSWESGTLGEYIINFDSKRVPVSGSERAKRSGPYPYHGATGVMDYVDDYLFDGIYVLVGEDGSVVKENGLAFTQYVWGKIWVNNHAHVLQGKGAVSTEQLLMYFQHETVAPYITGAVQLKLSQGRMNSMPFIHAGADICEAFSNLVRPLFKRLRANVNENKTLAETRDYLLPKLMSGDVRVREAEKALVAVA
ncbi:restriction endonuclease subunit S [Bradyrhizobium sp. RT11b]|uniref:restriction endonuclease subunit S n=1 Tax=Bradyrhizobium sp. RT11b TaxID=3156332 RepID=UPI0033928EF6